MVKADIRSFKMSTYIVVATFKPGTDMREVLAVIPEELAQVEQLRQAHQMGAVHVAFERGTVFIEVLADDEAAVAATVNTLPMARWFNLDIYATSAPARRPPSAS
jgi:hypothetical protein